MYISVNPVGLMADWIRFGIAMFHLSSFRNIQNRLCGDDLKSYSLSVVKNNLIYNLFYLFINYFMFKLAFIIKCVVTDCCLRIFALISAKEWAKNASPLQPLLRVHARVVTCKLIAGIVAIQFANVSYWNYF